MVMLAVLFLLLHLFNDSCQLFKRLSAQLSFHMVVIKAVNIMGKLLKLHMSIEAVI